MALPTVSKQHVPMEHRWGIRHDVTQSVRVATHSGLVARGTIRNVSMSGAFVEAPLAVKLFARVNIQFNSALDRRPGRVEGQVVRREPTGFALEWRELAPDVMAALIAHSEASPPAVSPPSNTPHLVFQRPSSVAAVGRLSVD